MQNQLEQLRHYSTIVCDTGDIDAIAQYTPIDATTNPSLLYAAAQKPQYAHLLDDAITWGQHHAPKGAEIRYITDKLITNFGSEILRIIPGRVSTEIDARLSFDTQGSIAKAKTIMELYQQQGVDPQRVLIKLAATWEGIQAAKALELCSIHCNITLVFALVQAVAAAEAHVTLISPFVGRILDWYKQHPHEFDLSKQDPGVASVQQIYHYYKKFGYSTQIMGASFRNREEIIELTGCDLITISPSLLHELSEIEAPIVCKLSPEQSASLPLERMNINETSFRWMLNNDPMAHEKLGEGIRKFAEDQNKLETYILSRM